MSHILTENELLALLKAAGFQQFGTLVSDEWCIDRSNRERFIVGRGPIASWNCLLELAAVSGRGGRGVSDSGTVVSGTYRQLYRSAIRHWGKEAQIGMAVEECAELIAALQQYGRGRTTVEAVAGEIADVMIMCQQLRLIYGPEPVDRAVAEKLQRLKGWLSKEGKA